MKNNDGQLIAIVGQSKIIETDKNSIFEILNFVMSSLNVRARFYFSVLVVLISYSCKDKPKNDSPQKNRTEPISVLVEKPDGMEIPEGMVWIPGGILKQGAISSDPFAMGHERPQHTVAVDGFFMDATEVTNSEYAKFVEETGYVTVAERAIDWEEMKKQLPPDTPKPHDSVMQPGSLLFKKPKQQVVDLNDYSQWWEWKVGANWRHPQGPGSDLDGRENYPVVHISYEDALAYCEWAGRRLPTEAEWEWAARGGLNQTIFPWGNDKEILNQRANTWSGTFPMDNDGDDGFKNKAPVASYPPNGYGLHDIVGNVWEWTQDWYNASYYKNRVAANDTLMNPTGPESPLNRYNPYAKEKVIKGGSFLCNANYCASYRVSARMANSLDSAQEHLGFRTVLPVRAKAHVMAIHKDLNAKIAYNCDIDTVFIAAPKHWHAPMAVMAMQADKYVYVEKPYGHDQHEKAMQGLKLEYEMGGEPKL
ncbi:SUMF1/EgtB/PvdO family nonheme iron enzyme [Allomuricauda sp. SCSIO 65647]|uniref:formylglycine-generating enzyme family protein n=1 Tax=Allomuricauda sp. SCSIO 65647 TaxID=2908843 RepID=UPI0028BE923F|nr:SUMF1/EgtB/PvdO family nonheme iron enzyme [Muricauda sp. SCSIO 65647]